MNQSTRGNLAVIPISSAVGLAFAGMVGVAQANTVTQPQALQEVTITASKRTSTVQETAMSVTAITGRDIQARGTPDFDTLAQSVPGISMRSSGPGQTEFEMRGITSGGGNSATVGFYLDDVPLSAPAAAQNGKVVIDPNLYDLNRVEVLRGPQGTLYGAGSMGGTIRLVTNAPRLGVFDATGQAILSDTDGGGFNHGENAMLNVPLGGHMALRAVGSYVHESGWINRVVIANGAFPLETANMTKRGNVLAAPVAANYRGVNDETLTGGRASLRIQPNSDLSITPMVLYQDIKQGGLNQIDSNPGTNAHYQPFDIPEPFYDRFDLQSLDVRYRLPFARLDSTVAHWSRDEHLNQDGTETVQWAFSSPSGAFPFYVSQGGIGPNQPATLEDDKSRQTSAEIRLTSRGHSRLRWLVGYYYADFQSDFDLFAYWPGAASFFGTSNGFSQIQPTKIIQNAVYGQLSYQLTSAFKVTAGLRRFSYNEHLNNSVSGFLSTTGSDAVAHARSAERDQGVTPRFNLSYQVGKNMLLYATVAKGFRPGGGNQPIPTSGPLGSACEANLQAAYGTTNFVAAPVSYAPDSVWSDELGEKATGFRDRLRVNSAAYFENWRGVQQFIPLSCGYNYTANSGVVHIYGAELEVNALLFRGLVLSANAAYSHARFAIGSPEAGIMVGEQVQDVPDWTSSVSLSYTHPLSDTLSLVARVDNNYVGSRIDATYAINHLASYDLTNVRAGLEGDHWTATLFVRNAFNKRAVLTDAPQITLNVPTFNRETVSQPLTYGIDVSYRLR